MFVAAVVLLMASDGVAQSTKKHTINHYSVELPASYRLKDITPKLMDFGLYAVVGRQDGKVRCTLYFGNHPDFPSKRWAGAPVATRDGWRTRKEFRDANRIEGVIAFEGLSYKGSSGTPYSKIHYLAERVRPADQPLLLSMLDSIAVENPHLK
ncbi:MAG TPA: hypothetical protein VGF45_04625 [Polyangia bacterium]